MPALRSRLHQWLASAGWYDRLEWSPPHRLFVRWNNPGYEAQQRAERAFYGSLVRAGSLVFDIGANKGTKTETFQRLGARVICVEPDSQCARTLRRRFPFSRRIHVVESAVGARSGSAELYRDRARGTVNTLSERWRDRVHGPDRDAILVRVTTLDQLISEFGPPDFVKIDVEGFELDVLKGLGTPIAALSFEANLDVFRAETLQCIARMEQLGSYEYRTVRDIAAEGWQQPGWVGAEEIRRHVAQTGDRYFEIFARKTA